MIDRSLSIAVAAGALVLTAMMPHQASALPRVGVGTQAAPALVQQAGTRYYRRYDRRTGDYVRAPFTEVDTRRCRALASTRKLPLRSCSRPAPDISIAAPEVMCECPSPRWIRGAVPGSLLPSRASIRGGAARGCGRRS